jgi:hypothetical protein
VDAKANIVDEKEIMLQDSGLGKRTKRDIHYHDEISDNKWCEIVDAGGDPDAENDKIRKRRKDLIPSDQSADNDLVKSQDTFVEVTE